MGDISNAEVWKEMRREGMECRWEQTIALPTSVRQIWQTQQTAPTFRPFRNRKPKYGLNWTEVKGNFSFLREDKYLALDLHLQKHHACNTVTRKVKKKNRIQISIYFSLYWSTGISSALMRTTTINEISPSQRKRNTQSQPALTEPLCTWHNHVSCQLVQKEAQNQLLQTSTWLNIPSLSCSKHNTKWSPLSSQAKKSIYTQTWAATAVADSITWYEIRHVIHEWEQNRLHSPTLSSSKCSQTSLSIY
jgi:hypothetical protein